MDSRLRRFPPDRASAVPYGQTVGNATRCPPLAHRSAAAHKLHSAQSNRYKIRESQNQIPGTGLSLFLPGDCPNDRDHRRMHQKELNSTRLSLAKPQEQILSIFSFQWRWRGVASSWLAIIGNYLTLFSESWKMNSFPGKA